MAENPFRCVDEIDIFMDAASRKLAMDTLIYGSLNRKHQLILITPQDVSMYTTSKEVAVFQMRPPERSAASQ